MGDTAERMKGQLLALSPQDRAELAYFLIESLDEGCDPDAEAACDAELARRMNEIESGIEAGESCDSVFAQVRAK